MNAYAPAFVERVNLAYHEEEASLYDGRHPEIMKDELERWSRVAELVASLKKARGKLTILDLGSGTGFVPERLAPALDTADECLLTDLSPAMMAHARTRLKGSPMRLRELIGAADRLDLPDGCADVVTMNSVVHHFPDTGAVFARVHRWLKPGGLVVIAHEPNALHYRNRPVLALDRLFRWQRRLRDRLRGGATSGDTFIDGVNRRLMASKTISKPMTVEEIESITDIHSPTAGRIIRGERGFDPPEIARDAFSGYATERFETYRFFGKADPGKVAFLRPFVRAVERAWPDAGALFMLILRKPS
jgi:SAM-dependent methyltransferase